jgi:hypothetical protein
MDQIDLATCTEAADERQVPLRGLAFDRFTDFARGWRVAFEACSELLDRERVGIGCALGQS